MDAVTDSHDASMSTRTPEPAAARRGLLREHGFFLGALLVGFALRVVVMVAFRPAFIYSDARTYLALADDLQVHPDRVVGYGAFLGAVSLLTHDSWIIAGLQHLLGLLTAVLGYALLRRWGVGALVATLAMLPLLLDAMQLVLEHSMLSDVVYDLVLLLGIAVLAWRRTPSVGGAALAGLVLGLSVLVRVSGEPVVIGAVGFCLLAASTWRARVLTSLTLVMAFLVPLAAYASWYHFERGPFALTTTGGRVLYMRTTGFVDCTRFPVPGYEQRLCPTQPIGQRKDPTYYAWKRPDRTAGMRPPPGVTIEQAFGDFARRAIEAQPGDYARIVLRDALLTLAPQRDDHYEYDTADKWKFETWTQGELPSSSASPLYDEHGGPLRTVTPLASFLAAYGARVYLWGPLMALLALVSVVGFAWPRRSRSTRAMVFLTASLGIGLTLVPVVTAEFVWRYVLPAVVLLPMAAAVAWTRIRERPSRRESEALEPRPGSTVRTGA